MRDILPKVLGSAALNESGLPKPAAYDWWHGMAAALLAVWAKRRDRANSTLDKDWKAAKNAVGVDIPSTELCPTMTVARAKTALGKLSKLKASLEWQFRSPQDLEVLKEPLPDLKSPQASAEIKARWQKLSKNAQCLEYCQLTAGYLAGIVALVTGQETGVDMGGATDAALCESFLTRVCLRPV